MERIRNFVMSSLVSFCDVIFPLSFFPRDVLDVIWNLIESVSEGFLTYSSFTEYVGVRHLERTHPVINVITPVHRK